MAAIDSSAALGILGAMEPEIAMLKANVTELAEVKVNAVLTVYTGVLGSTRVAFASAGVGPVFAATTATVLLVQFGVKAIVFTGVAGGLKAEQRVGDIVFATDCVNFDMDVTDFSPFPGCPPFARGELPFIHWLEYAADPALLALARAAPLPASFAAKGNVVREGRLITGSVFVTVPRKVTLVSEVAAAGLGACEAVEMECAAVAQVCRAFATPFLGLRALSDTMEGDANADFNAFTNEAADNLFPVVQHIVENYAFPPIDRIFKLCVATESAEFTSSGTIRSELDAADGFIHLSDRTSAPVVAKLFFTTATDLKLIELSAAQLPSTVSWVVGKMGDAPPPTPEDGSGCVTIHYLLPDGCVHVYGGDGVPTSAIVREAAVPLGEDGVHIFPEWL